jgi:putative membrane protein insertion efficiency factor
MGSSLTKAQDDSEIGFLKLENAIKLRPRLSFFQKMKNSLPSFLYLVYRASLLPFLKAVSPFESACRFYPSCGVYTKEAFETFSFWKATYLSGARLGKCHPFYKGEGFDPLPKKSTGVKTC